MAERTYCGTRQPMPQQYTRLGTSYECLRKGVGVGKYLGIQQTLPSSTPYIIPLVIIFVIWFIIFTSFILILTSHTKEPQKDR